MFITKKKHNQIIKELQKELQESKDLKSIIEKISGGLKLTTGDFIHVSSIGFNDLEINLGDNVPVYVEDYLGGKVIKQEATKVIEITKEGEVKTRLTKQNPDSGYSYKLIRNK